MKIKKRDGRLEQLSFDKVIYRLRKLCSDPSLGPLKTIDPDVVAQRVVSSIYDGVTSTELDEEAARIAVGMTDNLEYATLASRIVVSNLHKNTIECFSEVMELLYNNTDKAGNHMPIIADDVIEVVRKHKNTLNFAIDYSRDYLFDYFGFKTLEKSYLMKIMDKNTEQMRVVERPQHMYMRVAVGIHKDDIDSILKTYNLISQHYYTHASPTLFNAGSRLANLSSCFHEDTIVATVNKGPQKIKDIQIGDEVITHLGNIKKVIQLHKNPLNNRKFYEVQVAKSAPIKVTGNHKLWAIRLPKKKNGKPNNNGRCTYDIDFVRDFLHKDGCFLISTEYRNMKTKLDFVCVCGRPAKASFESIYYRNVRCNDMVCIRDRNKGKTTSLHPEWISVDDLRKGDYIGIPNKPDCEYTQAIDVVKHLDFIKTPSTESKSKLNYTFSYNTDKVTLKSHWITHLPWVKDEINNNKTHSVVNRFWTVDSDFAKLIGIFYGDGHIMKSKVDTGDEKIRGIGFTIHKDNLELVEFCATTGRKVFGIQATFHHMKDQNVTQVLFHSTIVGEVFKDLFGIYFDGKKVWNEMFKWNKELIQNLLEGIITTDGCVSKGNIVSIQMSNVEFLRDLYYLLRNNNIDCSYGKAKRQKNGTTDHIQISIPYSAIDTKNVHKTYTDGRLGRKRDIMCNNQYTPKVHNGFKFLKLENKIEIREDLPEYVYTLGVQDDHSYNVGGLIAENCFLIGSDDSIEGIYKTITDCGRISKLGGGIGVHISNIRARGSIIRGTNGVSDGIVPMLRVYNATANYVNQSGKRKGSFAMYLEPWHADILDFLDLKKNQGHDDIRARDLFYALWTPDLFMKQVEKDGDWYLMCPDECPGLTDTYGDDFERLYWKYVEEKRYKRVVKAQEVWRKVLDSQIETGVPYIGYKDAVNKKCNQKNLGTIKSSNLCSEISLYSDDKTYAVCNLCSIALPKYVEYDQNGNPFFNFEKLRSVAEYVVHPMNKVIDNNYYPTEETRQSNFAHRPLGIGVQGLADVYIKMKYSFDSKEAQKLNKEIHETIYYGLMQGTIGEAKMHGPYESFKGSPFSQGKFQFDLVSEYDNVDVNSVLSGRWDWEQLRGDLIKYGARNSMLTALMPTASTAQIMGNSEAFEAYDSCIFKRRVLSGEYTVMNKYLVNDLVQLGLWSKEMKEKIIAHEGSIQNIEEIPQHIKDIYKTVWELSMKAVIDQARDRGAFVDQMQSMNLFMANPNNKKLTSMHFYAWKQHLKTGMYYLRSKGTYQSGKFSIDADLEKRIREKQEIGERLTKEEEEVVLACSRENPEACLMCSS